MNAIRAVLASALLLLAMIAPAWADWVVARTTGTVWLVAPDSTAIVPTAGTLVPNTWMVATGPDGRAMLTRNQEVIALSPNSQMVITDTGRITQVFQPAGSIEFEVEARNVQHFSVQTPALAAVVKGTHFTVSVDGAGASVRVDRGAVEVTGLGTGERTTIEAGQEAEVDYFAAPLEVTGAGVLPAVIPNASPARPPATQAPASRMAADTEAPSAAPGANEGTSNGNSGPVNGNGNGNGNSGQGNGNGNGNGNSGQGNGNGNGNGNSGQGNSNGNSGHGNDEDSAVVPGLTDKDQCKDGGWEDFGFPNQGQCISYVNGLD